MFELILFIIIYFIFKVLAQKSTFNIINTKLNILFKNHNFSNISKTQLNGTTFVRANSHGENYLFAFKNTSTYFTTFDIDRIYEYSQKEHIHNPVILVLSSSFSDNLLDKIKEYNIQIWDNQKLESLISTYTFNNSVLHTSDTSNDTCKIDSNQFDPIQEPNSLCKKLFSNPNRL